MERRYAVFSVKPRFAEALVDGRKKFEFRRMKPTLRPGDVVYVYATSPVKAVIGSFVCGGVVEGSPTRLWTEFGHVSETSRADFREYFRDKNRAFAIRVMSPLSWSRPIHLDDMRLKVPGFCAPQSYRFVPKKLGVPI